MDKRHVNPDDHYSLAPASHAVRCGNTIYVTGQCALDHDLNVLHPGDLSKQTAIAMDNVRKVLAECGAGLDDVVKMTTFYVSGGARKDWELSVRERFRHFTGAGAGLDRNPRARAGDPRPDDRDRGHRRDRLATSAPPSRRRGRWRRRPQSRRRGAARVRLRGAGGRSRRRNPRGPVAR